MNKFLTLPTWQVFLLLIIPAFIPTSNIVGLLITLVWMIFIAFCVYFLGNSLFQKLPAGHDLKINLFQINLLFPLFYLVIIYIIFDGGYEINQHNFKDYGSMAWVIVPLHLFAMYCIIYTVWFIAKCIATVENKKKVVFENYAGYFFLLWFFPIGIWIVHPKIRKIFSETEEGIATG